MELIITAKTKILPTNEQAVLLQDTLHVNRKALNYASQIAYKHNLLSKFKSLQQLVYTGLREQFGLKSQMACNVCTVVAGSYATVKEQGENTLVKYKRSKLQYSYGRDYSFTKDGLVSVGTLQGRIKIPFITKGLEHYFDGSWEFGTATLVYKKGKFFLHFAVKKIFEDTFTIKNIVGVDFGMRFLATAIDSNDNHLFKSGASIKETKARYVRLRKGLQAHGTKSAKRKLQKVSGKENRFMTNINHVLSKALIQFAGKHSLIAIEDLTGINLTTTVRKRDRYYRLSWAFHQLRQMLEYKGIMNNIKVIAFDPAYTSQKCPKCGNTNKKNRNQKAHTFCCTTCQYESNDDRIGAMNLRQMGIEYHHKMTLEA
ncbi:IS200/IS605 family transposase ISDge19 [Bacillus rhizoplanae]|uniref:IS200/IS605 family transposase ISDge19 n=1 Tax=Bacillus rhizoplanae TaxID=2880966 RepID=A0ABM8Y7Y4_9BACI|nr:transposase [Bacillus rhizoplanae]CAG9611865.1 IS200/IS605 family transposase ISDge19 [Bacillus rhizoplanae]